MPTIELTQEDFLFFKKKIFSLAGIHLTEKKIDLVRTRIDSYLRRSGLASVAELKEEIQNPNSAFIQEFINLMTTNKTEFFREPAHFEYISKVIVPLFKTLNKKELKIWCCATSTGEEPYTLSMVLAETLPSDVSWRILATDIDTTVLERAENGVYSNSKSSDIPTEFHKYLRFGESATNGWFKISNELHSKVIFRKHNLIDSSYPGDEMFDVIFCRNVLIYFERKTILTLAEKLHRSLKSHGYLFIGHSESLNGASNLFELVQPAIYKKRPY